MNETRESEGLRVRERPRARERDRESESDDRTVPNALRLECRSDDTFVDSVMQARLCVRLIRGEPTVEMALCKAPERLRRGFGGLWKYGKSIGLLVHRQAGACLGFAGCEWRRLVVISDWLYYSLVLFYGLII